MSATLHDTLLACGFTHRATERTEISGQREIVDPDGRVVFTGKWDETWAWLRATHDLDGLADAARPAAAAPRSVAICDACDGPLRRETTATSRCPACGIRFYVDSADGHPIRRVS